MELRNEDLELSFFNKGSEFYPCMAGVCLTHKPTGISVRASSCWSVTGNTSEALGKLSRLVRDHVNSAVSEPIATGESDALRQGDR